jgi:Gas vesicle synthesis protein GvpL/GvpF
VIYAYGIADPTPGLPPGHRGIGGAALRILETNGLAVVYSRHRSLRPHPTPELVLAHERVLEAVMAHGPVLPMRFGTQLDSTDRLADAVAGRRRELLSALDRVRGCVELGVRVLPNDPPPTRAQSSPSGRDYVLSLAAAQRRNERVAADIHGPLQALASASVVRERSTSPAVMVAAYLVDARRVESFRRRAGELAANHRDISIAVTGPWPPYSFTGEEVA